MLLIGLFQQKYDLKAQSKGLRLFRDKVLNGNFGSDSLELAAIFALIHPRNAFFPFRGDYDALLCPKHVNCRGILNKSAAAA